MSNTACRFTARGTAGTHGVGDGAPYRMKRRGFTLIELLVVVAITAILLLLLLGPLRSALNLTARGQADVAAQDNVRHAMSRMSRELSTAMFVHVERPVNIWHYDTYQTGSDSPQPMPAAVPAPARYDEACIDLVLPKHRFYCTQFHHHLLDTEVPPFAALDECPRHPGSPVELQPIEPLQPEQVIVRYFVGLKQPGYPQSPAPTDETPPGQPGNLLPHYLNGFLFHNVTGAFNNLYVLYRTEFNPNDPAVANWRVDATQPIDATTGSGTPYVYDPANPNKPWAINRNFFYDPQYRDAWKLRSVPLVSLDTSDLVRWVQIGDGVWRPEPLARFLATPVEDEAAQPNRTAGAIATGFQLSPSLIAPIEHRTEYGHWLGLNDAGAAAEVDPASPQNDPHMLPTEPAPIPLGLTLANEQIAASLYRYGPRLVIYETDGITQQVAFDSGDASGQVTARRRLVAYDNRRGLVTFAIQRRHDPASPPANSASDVSAYSAIVEDGQTDPNERAFTVDLKKDTATSKVDVVGQNLLYTANGAGQTVPTSYGGAIAFFSTLPAVQRPFVNVVPGSEVVQRVTADRNNGNVKVGEPLRRVGWSGIGSSLDRYVAQAELAPDEYTIDYSTGVITLSERDPSLLTLQPTNQNEQLWVRYQFQTNRASDTVHATYSTRELITVNMGIIQYAQRTAEGLPFQATQRVRIRNMTR
jgi:prepilin-type N-terminal cleavage/methylation domain-containing protein